MKIEYRVPEHDSERISLEITINPNRYTVDQIAVSAAEDWFYNHEGIDSAWPIDFEIYIDNELRERVIVECEAVPQFNVAL